MSRLTTKPTKWHVRPAKTQISLGIHPVWSVFAVRMKKAWVLSYPLSAQRRLWSDWADAQADQSLRWAHIHFVGFIITRLNLRVQIIPAAVSVIFGPTTPGGTVNCPCVKPIIAVVLCTILTSKYTFKDKSKSYLLRYNFSLEEGEEEETEEEKRQVNFQVLTE